MSFFVGIVGLGFLILIHEAGHFFTALAVGMNPRKFYIGFPPAVAKVRRRGLTDLRDGLAKDAYWRAAPWKRVLVIFAGPGTNALFAVILFAFLFMIGG